MSNPDWFLILLEWKRKMGSVGVTLPFLFGALKLKTDLHKKGSKSVGEIMNEIIYVPVEGYVTQVQQCPNISETVLSVVKLRDKNNRVIFMSHFCPSEGRDESLVFSSDFQSKNGLKNKDAIECLNWLLNNADEHVAKGEYSKLKVAPGKYEFGDLSKREIEFVKSIIMT